MQGAKIEVTKLDAARRQLDCAATLYFHRQDPVSIHTLVHAAFLLLCDLAKHDDGVGVQEIFLKDCIRPECHEEVRIRLRYAGNFLKHAKDDPNAVLTLREEDTDFLFMLAVQTLRKLSNGPVPWSCLMYSSWQVLCRPTCLLDSSATEFYRGAQRYMPNDRGEFYKEALCHRATDSQERD